MWRKIILFILCIFIILILIPLFLIKGVIPGRKEQVLLLNIYDHKRDEIITIELEDYLRGVLAAEMPALYHQEALKAQAVAARTYALKQIPKFGGQGSRKYTGADLSTDFADCQAYLSESEMKERWGFLAFFYYWSRINRAVEDTRGQVLLYNNQLIDAVYHANSGGLTENAVYVWGKEVPYLQSVESPYDKEKETSYQSVFSIKRDELEKAFDTLKEERDVLLMIRKKTPSGRVLELSIGSKKYTGVKVREKLALSSTKFSISMKGDIYIFTCYGKGHGVGMSQDGADGFARNGYNYQQILKHYYKNSELGYYYNIK